MLNSGKKFRDKKNKYSNSCVVRKKNSERNKKPYHPPSLQVKWSVPYLMSQVKVKNSVYNRSCNKTRGRNQILVHNLPEERVVNECPVSGK
jgi:hypothetical protein